VKDEKLGLEDGAGWFAADVGGVVDECCRQLRLHGASDRALLTWFHCHGRTHVYALCCALVVDKLVCFHRTKANCHRSLHTVEQACVLLRRPDAVATGRRLSATMNEPGQLIYWAWRSLLRLSRLLSGRLLFDTCRETNARDTFRAWSEWAVTGHLGAANE
jgi:hypothetical protein